jgi:hypothetical protein
MRSVKSVLGVVGALVPILYCCGLLYYFLDLSGSPQEAENNGLGPTVLGLGVVALLFSIPLILKIVGLVAGTRPPGSSGGAGPSGPAPGIDADGLIARYRARGAAAPGAAPPTQQSGGTAKPPGFGRKGG